MQEKFEDQFFSRIASCNYVRYGTGGMQEVRLAICILGRTNLLHTNGTVTYIIAGSNPRKQIDDLKSTKYIFLSIGKSFDE